MEGNLFLQHLHFLVSRCPVLNENWEPQRTLSEPGTPVCPAPPYPFSLFFRLERRPRDEEGTSALDYHLLPQRRLPSVDCIFWLTSTQHRLTKTSLRDLVFSVHQILFFFHSLLSSGPLLDTLSDDRKGSFRSSTDRVFRLIPLLPYNTDTLR